MSKSFSFLRYSLKFIFMHFDRIDLNFNLVFIKIQYPHWKVKKKIWHINDSPYN